MNIEWINDFLSLAHTLNFTKAAKERNITQPAFSRRIQMLENWVETPLINRSTYPIELTEAGKRLLPAARNIIFQLYDLKHSFDKNYSQYKFQRFAVLHTISLYYLSQRFTEIEAQYPSFKMEVISENFSGCCQMLQDNACEFLLYYRHKKIKSVLNENVFVRKDLGKEKLIPVAQTQRAQERNWKLEKISTSDKVPYLSYGPNSFLGNVVDKIIDYRQTNLDVCYIDALAEALKQRALAGSGIAWLPEHSIKKELESGQLMIMGDEEWQTDLIVSLFCYPNKLDKIGHIIWEII